MNLVEAADTEEPDLIVLPETALHGRIFFFEGNVYLAKLKQILKEEQIHLLTGTHTVLDGKNVQHRVPAIPNQRKTRQLFQDPPCPFWGIRSNHPSPP